MLTEAFWRVDYRLRTPSKMRKVSLTKIQLIWNLHRSSGMMLRCLLVSVDQEVFGQSYNFYFWTQQIYIFLIISLRSPVWEWIFSGTVSHLGSSGVFLRWGPWRVMGRHQHPGNRRAFTLVSWSISWFEWSVLYTYVHTYLLCSPSLGSWVWLLEETTIFQVFFDDDVGYGIEHKLDVLCVCGTGHVRVDFFDVSTQVQVQKLHFNVVSCILIGVGSLKRKCQDSWWYLIDCQCLKCFLNLLYLLYSCDLTIVLREAHAEVSFLYLLGEHIFLVEEEYDGGGGKVAVVADTVEQVQTLVHSVLRQKMWGYYQVPKDDVRIVKHL